MLQGYTKKFNCIEVCNDVIKWREYMIRRRMICNVRKEFRVRQVKLSQDRMKNAQFHCCRRSIIRGRM
mgnify:CR=1 FL=1